MPDSNGHVALEDSAVGGAAEGRDQALDVIRMLASDIGPRRSCSTAEARGAAELVRWLRERGVDAKTDSFQGYSSFGKPYGLLFGAALAGGLLQRSRRRRARAAGDALAALSAIAGALEG